METVVKKSVLKKMLHEKEANVSSEALDMLANVITDMAEKVVANVVNVAKHAGRKTVKAEDVKLITDMLKL